MFGIHEDECEQKNFWSFLNLSTELLPSFAIIIKLDECYVYAIKHP